MKMFITVALSANTGAIVAVVTNQFLPFEQMSDILLMLAISTICVYSFIIYSINT